VLKEMKANVRPTMSDRTSVGFRTFKYPAADARNLGPFQPPCSPAIDARSIVPVANAYAQAGIAAPIAIARALNWTGNKGRTQVARTLARDTGVAYGVIRNVAAPRRRRRR
jgi:hypothetical protein